MPAESFLVIAPDTIQPGETFGDVIHRYERSIQDGLCPVCHRPMWPHYSGMYWYCMGCDYTHELPHPMAMLN